MDSQRLAVLEQAYQRRLHRYLKREGERSALLERKARIEADIAASQELLSAKEKAQQVVEQASSQARKAAVQTLEQIITDALQAVFGPDYACRVDLKEPQGTGRVEAEIKVVSRVGDEEVAGRPEDARGGGVADVVAVAARLAYAELCRTPMATIFLDEPTKFLASPDYRAAMADFLATYARQFDRQILIITQSDEIVYAADRAWRVEQKDGVSVATPIDPAQGGSSSQDAEA